MKTYYLCENASCAIKRVYAEHNRVSLYSHTIDAVFKAYTVNEMLSKLADFCNCEVSDAVLNNCENGWVSFTVRTNAIGENLSPRETQDFINGTIDAYESTYVFYVEEVISRPVNL